MGAPAKCTRCGASTPLPDDLTTPTFSCVYCHAVLSTAAVAGASVVSAERFVGYLEGSAANPAAYRPGQAPRFDNGQLGSQPGTCRHCGAAVEVPLDLRATTFVCSSCGRTESVDAYVSKQDRFVMDMGRQLAGNQALARLRAEGVQCPQCGARNVVPDDGSVQVTCSHCRSAIVLSSFVDADAIARSRLKHALHARRHQAVAAGKSRDKTIIFITFGAIALAAVTVAALALAGAFSR